MKKHFYLLAGELFDLITMDDNCCIYPGKSHFTAIISAVLEASRHSTELKTTNHNEWNLLHNYRSAIQDSADVDINITNIEVLEPEQRIKIFYIITANDEDSHNEMILERNHFKSELWRKFHHPGGKLLDSKESIDNIFCLFEKAAQIIEPVELNKAEDSRLTSTYRMYTSLHEIYNDDDIDERGKKQIETTLGAALFYLPHPVNESWNRLVSKDAIKQFKKGHSMVKDHIVPRRMASAKLLSSEKAIDYNVFVERFKTEFSKFSYVTSQENKTLINYEGDYRTAANNLGIEFLEFPEEFNHNQLKKTLLSLQDINQETLDGLLNS